MVCRSQGFPLMGDFIPGRDETGARHISRVVCVAGAPFGRFLQFLEPHPTPPRPPATPPPPRRSVGDAQSSRTRAISFAYLFCLGKSERERPPTAAHGTMPETKRSVRSRAGCTSEQAPVLEPTCSGEREQRTSRCDAKAVSASRAAKRRRGPTPGESRAAKADARPLSKQPAPRPGRHVVPTSAMVARVGARSLHVQVHAVAWLAPSISAKAAAP